MKRILIAILMGCTATWAWANHPEQDTVIIELNNNSKLIIYTKTKADLNALENYDFNKLISELNEQLNDSVTYIEIDGEELSEYLFISDMTNVL